MQFIPHIEVQVGQNEQSLKDHIQKQVDTGAVALYVWGVSGDRLAQAGAIGPLAKAVELAKRHDLPVGVGSHSLLVPMQCEQHQVPCDFYVKTLHSDQYPSATPKAQRKEFIWLDGGEGWYDNMWCIEAERTVEFMKSVSKPWIAFKVLAAGAIQTPRLLLANRSRQHPHGLANSSRQVGRNFMESVFWSSTGIVPDLGNSHVGLPSDAICWDFNGPQGIPDVIGGCRFHSAVQEIGLVGPIAYASRIVKGFGRALKEGVRNQFGHCLSVGAFGEFLPNDESRVDLDPTRKDAFGMALPRIHSHLGQPEISRLRFMAAQSRRLLQEAGASTLVEEYGAWDLFSATHVFGTCRMGASAANAVVDAQGRSHDHPNLYITDASVFPSSGGGEAPSLTIQAFALRAADSIVSGKVAS